MNARTLLPLTIALCAAFLGGCKAPAPPAQWVSAQVDAGNERLLFEVTELALRKKTFPVGAGLDPAKLSATSGWRISLAPFKGKGVREQAIVQYTREKEPGRYKAEVRVKRERNEDLVRPMDLTYAQWEPDPDDAEMARVILHFIEALLSTGGEVLRKAPNAQ
ncbi:MAG: hypothetical protein HZA53_18195 [Planctomycetes bacterium]|nr:hypothetical protein [Planctomycetota bacterium]